MAYASRQRYIDISKFTPINDNGEIQNAVKFGDGVNTSIKTSVDNICDYVTIDDTRWFVVNYTYLNGRQVELNLLRDVVGEFGLGEAYGKIERGYTDGILKYRKELSLNEVLKKRIPLKPSTTEYGNISIASRDNGSDVHTNEMWGILYFTKDSTSDKISINIPAFNPAYDLIVGVPNGSIFYDRYNNNGVYQSFVVRVREAFLDNKGNYVYSQIWNYKCKITYDATPDGQVSFKTSHYNVGYGDDIDCACILSIYFGAGSGNPEQSDVLDTFLNTVGQKTLEGLQYNIGSPLNYGFELPKLVQTLYQKNTYDYSGKTVKEGEKYYSYTSEEITDTKYGNVYVPNLVGHFQDGFSKFSVGGRTIFYEYSSYKTITVSSQQYYAATQYFRTELDPSSSGILEVDTTVTLIDEPYVILVTPLFDVSVTDNVNSKTYNVDRQRAFAAFNSIIESASGENGFLADAQIYPYCPQLMQTQTALTVTGQVGGTFTQPFFSVQSTYFVTNCSVQPLPYLDVKKEYITRNYSIVSPEQSSKFTFSFYDYANDFVENSLDADKNFATLSIDIKTALKPFAIISSAVIERVNSLKGLNYSSNLEGSQPSSNGFECSMSSNAFETYKRNNSNYQAIFSLDRKELETNLETERVNEKVQAVSNTLAATAFGAVTGASYGVGKYSKAAGALTGGLAAAATVGVAQGIQYNQNEKLREMELDLQQQRYELSIGTIKNLPNSINRISSFNEIIMQDFYFVLEVYECTDEEKEIVDNFIQNYGYGIGVYDYLRNYVKAGWFLKALVIKSSFGVALHEAFKNDILGGVYIND